MKYWQEVSRIRFGTLFFAGHKMGQFDKAFCFVRVSAVVVHDVAQFIISIK
jgi:hypothetical protein